MTNDLLKVIKKGAKLPGEIKRNVDLTIRNVIVDAVFPGSNNYHKNIFAKALTGGTKGTVKNLPKEIKDDIVASHVMRHYPYRTKSDPKNPILSTYGTQYPYQTKGKDGKPVIHKPGQRTSGSLGHVQLKIDPKGGSGVMTDKWKVDPDPNYKPGKSKVHADLKEGGELAARLYDVAKVLGTYKDINFKVPIKHKMLQPLHFTPQRQPMSE